MRKRRGRTERRGTQRRMADQTKQVCVVEEEQGGKPLKLERHEAEQENVDMVKHRRI